MYWNNRIFSYLDIKLHTHVCWSLIGLWRELLECLYTIKSGTRRSVEEPESPKKFSRKAKVALGGPEPMDVEVLRCWNSNLAPANAALADPQKVDG
ncbi:jg1929 [Pararge aegeria aegeria]|uniref:Jg1929 protein n=1 Tax=Pararge aegeria aegeria TaxID=348720 RepID=A0A8S4R495_9NEOP|nr:jg1929 [Pararge aegeria aegeria]